MCARVCSVLVTFCCSAVAKSDQSVAHSFIHVIHSFASQAELVYEADQVINETQLKSIVISTELDR